MPQEDDAMKFYRTRSPALDFAAASLQGWRVTPAWFSQCSPIILVIVGKSSTEHFQENMEAGALCHSQVTITALDGIAAGSEQRIVGR